MNAVLFAETDPIGYIIQGGCLALLGYLIIWSFPQMMKDLKEERKMYVDERREQREKFESALIVIQDRQDIRNLGLISGIKEQTTTLINKLDELPKAITGAVVSASNHPK